MTTHFLNIVSLIGRIKSSGWHHSANRLFFHWNPSFKYKNHLKLFFFSENVFGPQYFFVENVVTFGLQYFFAENDVTFWTTVLFLRKMTSLFGLQYFFAVTS